VVTSSLLASGAVLSERKVFPCEDIRRVQAVSRALLRHVADPADPLEESPIFVDVSACPYLRVGVRLSVASESKAGARARPSGPLSSAPARCLPKLAPNREILGIYARTFQSTCIASHGDARKTPSQPLELGSTARKIQTSALIVTFRRARFEIHAFVDGGARPSSGFATAFEPNARTRTRISTFE